jgi:hypothetical protein
MDTQILDRRIDALLADPLVSLMIRADKVDRTLLASQMRRLGRAVGTKASRDERPQGFFGRFFPLAGAGCAL